MKGGSGHFGQAAFSEGPENTAESISEDWVCPSILDLHVGPNFSNGPRFPEGWVTHQFSEAEH